LLQYQDFRAVSVKYTSLAASALQMAKGFKAATITASIIAVFLVLTGITISFYADLPAGATVVLVNFLLFALSFLVKKLVR